MINLKNFYQQLIDLNVKFFTGVPDTLLNEFCLFIDQNTPKENHVIAANEGSAIALAVGHFLGSKELSLVYMQNSGLGNALNPLLSLAGRNLYSIPMLMLIGWRGDPLFPDHPQHNKQGIITPRLLEELNIPFKVLEDNQDEVSQSLSWATHEALEKNSPVALIVKKGVMQEAEKENLLELPSDLSLTREEAIRTIINTFPKNTLYIATTGRACRELYNLREEQNQTHQFDFLNVGAMGHALSIASGLALSQPEKQVVCLDGDSAAIMHLGSLAVINKKQIPNLLHIVLNNGCHESVGGQPSAGFSIDFSKIAESNGYKTVGHSVDSNNELKSALLLLNKRERAGFVDVHIRKGMRSSIPPLKFDHKESKNLFMNNINI